MISTAETSLTARVECADVYCGFGLTSAWPEIARPIAEHHAATEGHLVELTISEKLVIRP